MHAITVVRRSPKSVRASRLRGADATLTRGTSPQRRHAGDDPRTGARLRRVVRCSWCLGRDTRRGTITTSCAGERTVAPVRFDPSLRRQRRLSREGLRGCWPPRSGRWAAHPGALVGPALARHTPRVHPGQPAITRLPAPGQPSERATIAPKSRVQRSTYRLAGLSVNGYEDHR